MAHEGWFDTQENRTLLAICARKLIANIGVGGIIWGAINTGLGILWLQFGLINIGVLILGVMMLGTGVRALKNPTLHILLLETIITVLLLVWNVFISIWNMMVTGEANFGGIIFPLIIAITFFKYYRSLQHVKDEITTVRPEEVKAAKAACKALIKKKLKDEPGVIQTTNRKCRVQLMDDKAFFIQRDLMRAFVVTRENVERLIGTPEAKSLRMLINHPLGELKYKFNRKNSDKLKSWLAAPAEEPGAFEADGVLEGASEGV